jgi:hypothetical protein
MNLRSINGCALLAATTLVMAACGGADHDAGMQPPSGNTVPVMSAVADRNATQDGVVGPIEFGIADRESDVGALKLTAAADSGTVFPVDGIVLSGSGSTRTLTLTPLESATGVTAITLTVTDPEGASATRTFRVTVNARSASMRDVALATFAKAEADAPTPVNGFTFDQDADDPQIFLSLIGAE